jgi:hypothetical protein
VGKFGSIYYDKEAFDLYRHAFDFFGDSFRLIILSGDNHAEIISKLQAAQIDLRKVTVRKVPHHEVCEYLSAADFAFSTIKPVPSRLYCSPIKNGEYWANGLPILIERGIGDDSLIIETEGGGVILETDHIKKSFQQLRELLTTGREALAGSISVIAHKHRRMQIVRDTYQKMSALQHNTRV